ncbi:uncharacterized protein V6R79_021635 [Siganus canaliculatus]
MRGPGRLDEFWQRPSSPESAASQQVSTCGSDSGIQQLFPSLTFPLFFHEEVKQLQLPPDPSMSRRSRLYVPAPTTLVLETYLLPAAALITVHQPTRHPTSLEYIDSGKRGGGGGQGRGRGGDSPPPSHGRLRGRGRVERETEERQVTVVNKPNDSLLKSSHRGQFPDSVSQISLQAPNCA